MTNNTFTRSLHLSEDIVILDGLTGTGKTMFAPLLNTFDRMQNGRFEYMIEYLSITRHMNKISDDASFTLLNLLADVKIYDGVISREVNFRPSDLSSIFNSGKSLKYIKQLFLKDGIFAGNRIQKEKPILFFVTHQLLTCFDSINNAFEKRFKIIEMVRHPLYLLDHWNSYISMHGKNSRDFTIWIKYKEFELPWFAQGWEELYINSSDYDKVVYAIVYLMKPIFEKIDDIKYADRITFIPFEKFVLNPKPYLIAIEKILGVESTKKTFHFMKSQKVPRKLIFNGPQKNIYKRYAVKKNNIHITHEKDYEHKFSSAKLNCSPEAYTKLIDLINLYEKNFGLWF